MWPSTGMNNLAVILLDEHAKAQLHVMNLQMSEV